jgi:Spy/CpxP family protein refolding chaperone
VLVGHNILARSATVQILLPRSNRNCVPGFGRLFHRGSPITVIDTTTGSDGGVMPFREVLIRKSLVFAALCAILASTWAVVTAGVSAQQPTRISASMPVDDVLKAVRSDLQNSRADIVAKNVSLTSDQAAKFWPVFQQYQQEQNAIMDDQLKGIQQYVEHYETLDDTGALAVINAHFERDSRMNALRQRWLGELQKVLPTRTAVRVMQIDRRLWLVHQIEFAAEIPLVH